MGFGRAAITAICWRGEPQNRREQQHQSDLEDTEKKCGGEGRPNVQNEAHANRNTRPLSLLGLMLFRSDGVQPHTVHMLPVRVK